MWSDAIPVAPLMRVSPKKAKMIPMLNRKMVEVVGALSLGALVLGCGSSGGGGTGGGSGGAGAGGQGGGVTLTTTETVTLDPKTTAGNCLTGTLQLDSQGQPNCTVTAQVGDGGINRATYGNCAENNITAPCWALTAGGASCQGQSLMVASDPKAPYASLTVSCQVCEETAGANGCPCVVQTTGAVNGPNCIP
jgi:hypothetical protein